MASREAERANAGLGKATLRTCAAEVSPRLHDILFLLKYEKTYVVLMSSKGGRELVVAHDRAVARPWGWERRRGAGGGRAEYRALGNESKAGADGREGRWYAVVD